MIDMRMPGFDGLKLQEELNRTLPHLSIVFVTGHGNVPMTVKAMRGGAVDFLEKPVDDEALLTAIHRAAERSHALKASRDELERLTLPFGPGVPSEAELRIAQAQLVGWLEGLFHGIQTALYAQQKGLPQPPSLHREWCATQSARWWRSWGPQ